MASVKPMTFGLVSDNKKAPAKKKAKPASIITMPTCPKCHKQMWATEMKVNGKDWEGNYYELYHCSGCGHRFSVTYEGPSDRYHWRYD